MLNENDDMLQPVPPELPPFREINHEIPIIDESKRYTYHLPRCAESLRVQLLEKIERYTAAGWWVSCRAEQAAPLLCVLKKDGRLRTVVDLRQRNDNTVKDVTPFPDQETIRDDVARAKYRSKLDMSDAYEQTRIRDADVPKTAFATIYGTFYSRVMQQGDCNAPSTFQRLVTHIFRERIGRSIHVYLDDIFIFTDTFDDHIENIRWVFSQLREHKLYLSKKKCDFFSERMDCLGHLIDKDGLHADHDKMARIRDWPTPRNYHDVQRFLGLVQYLAHFMPDVSAYTGPLAGITRNGQAFEWRPMHQKCLDSIKALACKTPILRPIDPRTPEPIWVITDASTAGVGAVYGQGPEWQNCRPAGFMSKKFTPAQHAYFTYEAEALAVLEALMKWHDKLIGRRFTVVTDHRALLFLKSKSGLSPRLTRWVEYLSRFDFEIMHVPGEANRVADALSRIYLHDEEHGATTFDVVTADARLDPGGDELPSARMAELRAQRIVDAVEPRVAEAAQMAARTPRPNEPVARSEDPLAVASVTSDEVSSKVLLTVSDLKDELRMGTAHDPLLKKILAAPEQHERFRVQDGIVQHRTQSGHWVTCVPNAKRGPRKLVEIVLDSIHTTIGHLGARRTSDYTRKLFWWPSMGRDIALFCKTCGVCQTIKSSTQSPQGLLHSLPIPTRPWQSIAMDFVGPFPTSDGFDYLWLVIDRLTSQVHLVPITTTTRASGLAWQFVREVVRLHGLPESIVSDRDSKFVSKFWREVHRLLGGRLLMSTAYHPQTDGTSERAVQTASQILRALVQPDQRDWVQKIPMVEFAMNSSRNASSGFAPFELTYGYLPTMIREIRPEVALPGVREFADRIVDSLREAHDAIIASRVEQTHYANTKRRPDDLAGEDEFIVGKKAYLSTENLALPKGRARKLMPKYIGPYEIVAAAPESSTYTLALPPELVKRRIHPTFHVSRLRRHEPNDDAVFPHREVNTFYDFGDDPEKEWLVDDIIAHEWHGNTVRFLVQWTAGDYTWEPWTAVRELEAISRYFDLMGVTHWRSLPKSDKEERAPARATRDATAPPGHETQEDRGDGRGPADITERAGTAPDSMIAAPATEHELGRGKRRKRPSRRALEAAD